MAQGLHDNEKVVQQLKTDLELTHSQLRSELDDGTIAQVGVFVVVGSFVLIRDEVNALGDVGNHEVSTLAFEWFPRQIHAGDLFHEVVSVTNEELLDRLREVEVGLVPWLRHVVKRVRDGDLSWDVEAVVAGVCNDGAQVDELLRSDGPADLPSSAVHELASAEDRDRPV